MAKVIYSGQVPDRSLTVIADGVEVKGLRHVRLTADYMESLFPAPYCLRIWNPKDEVVYRMKRTKEIEVCHQETLLAKGEVTEVFREVVPEGVLLSVTFCLGKKLWEKYVSVSLSGGMSAVGTIQTLLAMAGGGVKLLARPKRDPGCARPQAFCGRLGRIVEGLLLACGTTGYLVPAGIAVRDVEEMSREVIVDMDSIDGPWVNEVIGG